MSPAFLQASLDGRMDEAAALLHVVLPVNWLEEHARYWTEKRVEQMANAPEVAPWLMRAMVRRDDRRMVGYINFHGAPNDEGQAELGYTVFEDQRRRGYATEATLAMMGWAREEHGVRRFLLSISPSNQPSLGLAAKLGFQKIGSQIDEIDGEEYVFELVVP
jgi:RimJ/RimL family protein N-acetyltransferase